MQLTIRLLGVEMLHVELCESADDTEACDYTSQPIGFVRSPGDQRWAEADVPDLGE